MLPTRRTIAAALALTIAVSAPIPAQDRQAFARTPKLFIELASRKYRWEVAAEPMKIVGPVHFVGTEGLGVWLIATSEGHILINTGFRSSGPMIAESIRKLGFKPEDIRLLLACHAHIDHVGGHAYVKELSGAQVAMLEQEVAVLETGGSADFFYGKSEAMRFKPAKVDRVLLDNEVIKLGDVALTVLSTPGHARGATTFVTNVVDGGKAYTVVFPNGAGVNPGYRVARNPSYPGIGEDYRRTLHILETLHPDIWLAPHTNFFDFAGKRSRAEKDGVRAWVDPEGYRRWVAAERQKFESIVSDELGTEP